MQPVLDFTPEERAALQAELDRQQTEQKRTHWISKARNCFESSTDYLESAVRGQWEKNLHHFRNQHAPGSKLAATDYRRSNVFRPKTRASLREHEASLAAALFTNNDLIDVQPRNPGDDAQVVSARINAALLQYRLEHTIPWFQTAVGAYQDTHNYGLCISKQYWRFEQRAEMEPALDEFGQPVLDEDGMPMGYEKMTVVEDKPVIDLLPPENFRFDPNADWRDPVADSPYLIEMMPMYAGKVLERMELVDQKTGQPEWMEHSLGEILSHGGSSTDMSGVRQAREGKRTDPMTTHSGNEFSTVWVHFNVIREGGQDWCFYTIGTGLLLSEPVPLTQVFSHGRPYVVGTSTLEAHRNYPASTNELLHSLQSEVNSIANQRLDNVSLVLNKRYRIRRGANVDLDALMRNVPGGGYFVTDVNKDVAIENTPDVTASSYSEHDRLAVEMDELSGNFSQSSVQSNRSLNETVGGMNLMQGGASKVQEYVMRLFIESWVEKVLRQLVQLEQLYETDAVVLAIAADEAQLWQRYGIDQVTDELLQQELSVKVNVGMGNTDPVQRIQRLTTGINAVANLPTVAQRLQEDEVVTEVFTALGFGRGNRFVKPYEQWAKEQEEQKAGEQQPDAAMLRAQVDQQRLELDMQRMQFDQGMQQQRMQMDYELAMYKLQMQREIELGKRDIELGRREGSDGLENAKLQTARDIAALRERNKANELAFKMDTGQQGI
jgi:hypothetical protein